MRIAKRWRACQPKSLVIATFPLYLPGVFPVGLVFMAAVRFGDRKIRVPGPPLLRILIGIALIFAGVLGFLPVLGFWMLPLGVLVLSVDLHPVRRWRRRVEVWWGRRQKSKREGREG